MFRPAASEKRRGRISMSIEGVEANPTPRKPCSLGLASVCPRTGTLRFEVASRPIGMFVARDRYPIWAITILRNSSRVRPRG